MHGSPHAQQPNHIAQHDVRAMLLAAGLLGQASEEAVVRLISDLLGRLRTGGYICTWVNWEAACANLSVPDSMNYERILCASVAEPNQTRGRGTTEIL